MATSDFRDIAAGLKSAIDHAAGRSTQSIEHEVTVPHVDVAQLRDSLGLSQTEFAEAFGVSVGTIRNWEQGRRSPRGPARVLLNVIAKEPEAVMRVLRTEAA